MTLRQFAAHPKTVPAATSWYLADLGEAKGRQELFTRQAPQKLRVLREHALIESSVSSNRIEGVTVDPRRVKAVVLQREGRVECIGRGPGARWRKEGTSPKRGQ